MAPRSEIQAQARAVSFGRGGSKRTFAMLMVSAGKSAFKARKKKKQALKSKKGRPDWLRRKRMAAWRGAV